MAGKMGFSVVIFVAAAAFGSTVGVAWRAGSLSLPILLALLAIGLVLGITSSRKEREWTKHRSETDG